MTKPIRLFAFFMFFVFVFGVFHASYAGNGAVYVTKVEGAIHPVVYEQIREAIKKCEFENGHCLVIEMDTPGGVLETTREIVKLLLNSGIPIIVYVSPKGARAASAGVFITMAANVAAMAPGTNIGAAHPVDIGPMKTLEKHLKPTPTISASGKDETEDGASESDKRKAPDTVSEYGDSVMAQKIMQDTVAWARNIARMRGRNEEWIVAAVEKSESITADKALEKGVVDFIAEDFSDLLAKLQDRKVKLNGKECTLDLRGRKIIRIEQTLRQKLLSVISNPNIAYLLFLLGMLGIYFEMAHPGVILPGVVGAISMILALYAFHQLPISVAGLALLALGVVMVIADLYVASHGVLSFGGVVSFIIGSLLLIDSPDPSMQIARSLIAGASIMLSLVAMLILYLVVTTFGKKVKTGEEGLLRSLGYARADIGPEEGKVEICGEIWEARAESEIPQGRKVRVTKVDGLKISVEEYVP